VRACAEDPAARARWRRRIRAPKIFILALFLLALGGVAWKAPSEISLGRAIRDLTLAQEMREGQGGAAPVTDLAARLRSAVALSRKALLNPALRSRAALVGIAANMALADEALRHGDWEEARRIAAEVEAEWPRGDEVGDFNRKMLAVELAAIDPARDLASLGPAVREAQADLQDLLRDRVADRSSDLVARELRFLAAVAGLEGQPPEFDPDDFESARLLALARGVPAHPGEAGRALRTWETNDFAWRRAVLERALGRSPHEAMKDLVATETRRGT
jgi:hypothetical protein